MAKENRGERSEPTAQVTRRQARRRGPATYDEKFRRLMLIVAGKVLEPSVEPPASLVAQAHATLLALVAAEFGDELNIEESDARITQEDDTWPDAFDVDQETGDDK